MLIIIYGTTVNILATRHVYGVTAQSRRKYFVRSLPNVISSSVDRGSAAQLTVAGAMATEESEHIDEKLDILECVRQGNMDVLRRFLRTGGNVNVCSIQTGRSMLHIACRQVWRRSREYKCTPAAYLHPLHTRIETRWRSFKPPDVSMPGTGAKCL